MDYVVSQTKQIGVEANSPEEAVKKVLAGEGTAITSSFSAQPRPKRPPTQAMVQREEKR
jgi:hypothetical protein